ncbi:MAG: hypothetical protein AAFO70_00385, partial [Pseudomonadota bacterium]
WSFDAEKKPKRPEGAWDGQGFMVTPAMLSILGATHEDMGVILQALGYRGESMLESDVQAKLAGWDGTEVPEPEAKPEPSEGEEPAEPARVSIWRQARRDQGKRPPRREARPQKGKLRGKDNDRSNKSQERGPKPTDKRKEREAARAADPDNPFAALAALKGK